MWDLKKDLVREIKFTDPIAQAVFLNDKADLLVSHSGKLSIIHSDDYKPFEG